MRTALFAAWIAFGLWAAPASSHVALLESEPADGAVLTAAPAVMVLRFADPVAPMSAQIVGAGLKKTVTMTASQETVKIALPAGLAAGPYIVSWKVGSLDDHPVTGSLMFSVGSASPKPAGNGAARARATERDRVAEILVVPAAAGRNTITARLRLPKAPQEVAVELSQKEAGIEPLRRIMQKRDNAYVLEGPELLVPGTWSLSFEVLIDEFDKSFFDADIAVR